MRITLTWPIKCHLKRIGVPNEFLMFELKPKRYTLVLTKPFAIKGSKTNEYGLGHVFATPSKLASVFLEEISSDNHSSACNGKREVCFEAQDERGTALVWTIQELESMQRVSETVHSHNPVFFSHMYRKGLPLHSKQLCTKTVVYEGTPQVRASQYRCAGGSAGHTSSNCISLRGKPALELLRGVASKDSGHDKGAAKIDHVVFADHATVYYYPKGPTGSLMCSSRKAIHSNGAGADEKKIQAFLRHAMSSHA